MKKTVFAIFIATILSVTNAFSSEGKGLNVILTSGVPQTQMMAMVLSTMTMNAKKEVNIVLCSEAGDLAVKGKESPLLKPKNKSPKMLLQGLIKMGAKVEVCPLYLPNAGLGNEVLLEGITVAKPPKVAAQLLKEGYTTLSY